MSVTLDDVLALAGRLDDSGGFDAPRERFRRFLTEHATGAQTARSFIEPCQQLVDEQHHRALQDLVAILGRPLGFETSFGSYEPVAGARSYEGCWWSGTGLEVVLEVRTNQTARADFDRLERSMAAHAATARPGPAGRVLGLSVVTPLFHARDRLEQSLDRQMDWPIRIVSIRSLLLLADLAGTGRLPHADVVRLFDTVPPLDFVAGLLGTAAPETAKDAPAPAACWLAGVTGDNAITPERFLEVVVGKRRLFGVRDSPSVQTAARAGDRICFFLAGKGVVGHADVSSIGPGGAGLRDGHQYSQLLRLERTRLYLDAPVTPDLETTLRLRAARGEAGAEGPPLVRISDREFAALTAERERAVRAEDPRGAGDRPVATPSTARTVSDAGSR